MWRDLRTSGGHLHLHLSYRQLLTPTPPTITTAAITSTLQTTSKTTYDKDNITKRQLQNIYYPPIWWNKRIFDNPVEQRELKTGTGQVLFVLPASISWHTESHILIVFEVFKWRIAPRFYSLPPVSVPDPWHFGVNPCLWLMDPDPGSGSCYFRYWASICQQKTNFLLIIFECTFTLFFKDDRGTRIHTYD